jgi:hypothetical protein
MISGTIIWLMAVWLGWPSDPVLYGLGAGMMGMLIKTKGNN